MKFKVIERINVLKELADLFFNKYEPTKESLEQFLADNQWRIYSDYEHNCHREDIVYELADSDYDTDRIPAELIDEMVDEFEDRLGDYGSECGWRTIMNETIDYFEEDLKEYSNRESEE